MALGVLLVFPGLGRSSFWLCASPDAKKFRIYKGFRMYGSEFRVRFLGPEKK